MSANDVNKEIVNARNLECAHVRVLASSSSSPKSAPPPLSVIQFTHTYTHKYALRAIKSSTTGGRIGQTLITDFRLLGWPNYGEKIEYGRCLQRAGLTVFK